MWAYGWLIFIAVISIITFPLTAVMNALVIIAVKTKHRLKTKSNIALACLSTTDLTMGVSNRSTSFYRLGDRTTARKHLQYVLYEDSVIKTRLEGTR